MKQRLDKLLSLSGERTRSQSQQMIRAGMVSVHGSVIRDPSAKADDWEEITLNGKRICADQFLYGMLYKPAGVLTACEDRKCKTVMDLLPEAWKHRNVMPVGRLDKDTTGLLLFTNDGNLAHLLLSPKREVWKRYIAVVSGCLMEEDVFRFEQGIPLKDFTAKPAQLRILESNQETSMAEVCVHEGKYHQVKRMFLSCGHEVLKLHRASFGPITLPDELNAGDYRTLTKTEVKQLQSAVRLGDMTDDK